MGVIKRSHRTAIDASIVGTTNESSNEINIDSIDSQDETFDVENNMRRDMLLAQQLNSMNRRRSYRARVPAIPIDTTPIRNNVKGSRRSRRHENTLHLLRDAGKGEEIETDEVSIEDFVPIMQGSRTFNRFLSEASMNYLLTTFLECRDEKELKKASCHKDKVLLKLGSSTDPDSAYFNICRRLRNILNQRHVPLGIVDNLERDVLQFFTHSEISSTYECGPLDAYRRGLLHAISQYNNLKSFSVGTKKTQKIVHVQVRENVFSPPAVPLVSYIEKKNQMERL